MDAPRRSSRRPKSSETVHEMTSLVPLKKSRRAVTDNIDGIDIHSFEDELHMEYFANLEEPLPRKLKPFRGFSDSDDSINFVKHYFDLFMENFLAGNEQVDVPQKRTPKKIVHSRKKNQKKNKKVRSSLKANQDVEEGRGEAEEVKDVVEKPKTLDDSVELVSVPVETITITDEDSDDDCVMTSDPTAPIPLPVAIGQPANCCRRCGKFKGAAGKFESDGDSALGDELMITTDVDDTAEAGRFSPASAGHPKGAEPDPLPAVVLPPAAKTPHFDRQTPPTSPDALSEEMPLLKKRCRIVMLTPNGTPLAPPNQDESSSSSEDFPSTQNSAVTTPVTPIKKRPGAFENALCRTKPDLPLVAKDFEAATPTQSTPEQARALTLTPSSADSPVKTPSEPTGKATEPAIPSGDRAPSTIQTPTEDLTNSESPQLPANLPQNRSGDAKSPSESLPASVQVRSITGKPFTINLPGTKSKIIGQPRRLWAENPSPLKTYCKSTKHPNFIHHARDNGTNGTTANSPSDNPDVEPQGKKPAPEEILSPKISSAPVVYQINPAKPTPGNPCKWAAVNLDGKNIKCLKRVGEPKTRKTEAVTTPKSHPVNHIDAPKNPTEFSLPKVTLLPHEPYSNSIGIQPGLQVTVPPPCNQRSETPAMPIIVLDLPKTNAVPIIDLDGPGSPRDDVEDPDDSSISDSSPSKVTSLPHKSNSNTLKIPPSGKVTIPPNRTITGIVQRSEPPVMPAVILDVPKTNAPAPNQPYTIITPAAKQCYELTFPPRGSVGKPPAPTLARLDNPRFASGPNLHRKSLASSNGARPQGCRVLKVHKPMRTLAFGSPLNHGLKVLKPVTAFRHAEDSSSDVLVVDDAVESVVLDMVDFVCKKETFPTSFPYDSAIKPERPCSEVPCGYRRCRLGCVCVSLSKKSIRRARCKKVDCIFGCVCDVRNSAAVQGRQTIPLILRRKHILGSSDYSCETPAPIEASSEEPTHSVAAVNAPRAPPVYETSKTPKVNCTVSKARKVWGGVKPVSATVTSQSTSKISSPATSKISSPATPKISSLATPKISTPATPKISSLNKSTVVSPTTPKISRPGSSTTSSPAISSSTPILTPDLPTPAPRRFFGREKVPIPEQALICLTPGFGYVPLEEISSTRVTVSDPFQSGRTKGFLNVRQATEWLNSTIRTVLSDSETNLRWVVATKNMIETKQLHRLNLETLKTTKSSPIRTSAIRAQ